MKTYEHVKRLAINIWAALKVKSLGPEEDKLEIEAFNNFLTYFVNVFICVYCIFSFFCLYFFITRAIFY